MNIRKRQNSTEREIENRERNESNSIGLLIFWIFMSSNQKKWCILRKVVKAQETINTHFFFFYKITKSPTECQVILALDNIPG